MSVPGFEQAGSLVGAAEILFLLSCCMAFSGHGAFTSVSSLGF